MHTVHMRCPSSSPHLKEKASFNTMLWDQSKQQQSKLLSVLMVFSAPKQSLASYNMATQTTQSSFPHLFYPAVIQVRKKGNGALIFLPVLFYLGQSIGPSSSSFLFSVAKYSHPAQPFIPKSKRNQCYLCPLVPPSQQH